MTLALIGKLDSNGLGSFLRTRIHGIIAPTAKVNCNLCQVHM
jgi:hypothetical protein